MTICVFFCHFNSIQYNFLTLYCAQDAEHSSRGFFSGAFAFNKLIIYQWQKKKKTTFNKQDIVGDKESYKVFQDSASQTVM